MLELRRPQVIEDHRGTLVVIEGVEFGIPVFRSVRLVDLPRGTEVRLPKGAYVLLSVRGTVAVQSGDEAMDLIDRNMTIIAKAARVTLAARSGGSARVAIMSADVSHAVGAAKVREVGLNVSAIEPNFSDDTILDVDWAAHVPFPVKRLYFTHSVGNGAQRGGHAHRDLRQLIVAADGIIDLRLQDKGGASSVCLDGPLVGALVRPVTWREIWMGRDSYLMVLASEPYDESEYIRDYADFWALSSDGQL